MTSRLVTCSNGHAVRPVRILYGMPTPETAARADRGEIVLGGCVLTGDDPEWACPTCGLPIEWASRRASRSSDDGRDEPRKG